MKYIDANGARIPTIGLGTWELRGRTCARLVQQAFRLGYRHIDTAQAYDNEREVGEGFRASGVRRHEAFITTKVWWTHFAPRELERSVKESLVKLRMPEVDLLLLHWPNSAVPLGETMGALCKMKTLGLTRHIGVSNFTIALMEQAVALSTEPLVTNQVEYHPYLNQAQVVAAARNHGLSVTAYSPIARGRASADDVLQRIGKVHERTAAQITLRWLVQQGVVVIPRTSRVERLNENLDIFDFELTEEEMGEIGQLARPRGRLVNTSWAPNWD
ncbi:MAG TPA: aldo/keto reductase [Xanthobacteraceae bacterium]|jgi:diketogulonate reductase-like aldo/keto reductase|nr:aldo/keto reductase [Xanthobacteraceae bacterium]